MIHSKKRQEGIKLIELLLVIAVGAGILYYSFLQYLSYRRDADVYQVRYNVDLIFQAMSAYFRANCNKSPLNADFPGGSYGITMDDLTTGGYFTSQLTRSPLIAQIKPTDGYVMQFNQVTPAPYRMQNIDTVPPQTPPLQIKVGKILIWNAQVSVLLKNASTARQYGSMLQANCMSTAGSAGGTAIVNPCENTPAPPGARYAVWMRLPSLSNSKANSDYWPSMPVLKQFTQRYTTYPLIIVNDQSIYADDQFFVCGT